MNSRAGWAFANHFADHFARGANRAEGMVAGLRARVVIREYRKDAVADEFIHMTVVFDDNGHHYRHVDVQEFDDNRRVLGFAEGREAADIGEEDGDEASLAFEADFFRLIQR